MSVFNVPTMTLGGSVGQPPPMAGGTSPYGAPNTGGSNQWGSGWPVLPSPGPGNNVPGFPSGSPTMGPNGFTGSDTAMGVPPGAVPPAGGFNPAPMAGGPGGGTTLPYTGTGQGNQKAPISKVGAGNKLSGGQLTVPSLDPYMTQQMMQYLTSQMGQGVSPFNLSAPLPTGGSTQPGQLSPGLDPISQALQTFYSGGSSSMPGSSQLSQMAQTGDPISALPEWNAMVQAMQQQIGTGAANVREQEAFSGNLPGSSGALATSMYQEQTSKDLNAQLLGAQTTALENAQNRKMGAGEFIQQGAEQFAPYLQGLDQQAIQNMYQEFIRTQPQYNPLLGYEYAGATTFPPTYHGTSSTGGLGGLLSGIGSLAGGLGSLGTAASDAGGLASLFAL